MRFAADAVARVDTLLADAASDAPGCAVGVVGDGEVLFARGCGLASLEHRAPITSATRFYMGSVSKQVTALAVLIAAASGPPGLDDPIRGVVPELPKHADGVTLRHLLSHTSGVRDYFTLGFLAGLGAEHAWTERDVLEIIGRQRALNFRPGDDFLYSNSGYVLLAIAIARCTGERLDAFAREAIFAPLGMHASHFQHDHAAVVPDKASGYEKRGSEWRCADSRLDAVGDGGLYASLDDMLAWTRNLVAPRVGASAIAQMSAPARVRSGAPTGYGMGLGIGAHRGLATLEHGGGLAGYRTHLLAYPTEGLGVVILANDAAAWPGRLARRVGEAFLEARMAPAPERAAAPPVEVLRARAGCYRASDGDVVSLVERDGGLCILGVPPPLSPLGPASFALGGDPDVLRLDFEPADGGFALAQASGPLRRYQRCEPPAGMDLDPYLGDFNSAEAGAGCTVSRGEAGLKVSFAGGLEAALRPIAADCLLAPDFGATLTFRRGGGAVSGFQLDGGRLRRIAYRKAGPRETAC